MRVGLEVAEEIIIDTMSSKIIREIVKLFESTTESGLELTESGLESKTQPSMKLRIDFMEEEEITSSLIIPTPSEANGEMTWTDIKVNLLNSQIRKGRVYTLRLKIDDGPDSLDGSIMIDDIKIK